jgi:DNA-directed RNA polymerase specialized sigma24 family protein
MALTQTSFDLLLTCLHPDRERAAEAYESTRKTLIKFFEWQNCANAEACADETIDRVAKKIDQGKQINDLTKYFRGVARLIAYEVFKDRERQANLIRQLSLTPDVDAATESEEDQARRHCMETCLHNLSRENFELITRYCQPENKAESKKNLAEERSILLNALRIRVHRIRRELKKCYAACLQREQSHEII